MQRKSTRVEKRKDAYSRLQTAVAEGGGVNGDEVVDELRTKRANHKSM